MKFQEHTILLGFLIGLHAAAVPEKNIIFFITDDGQL